jgi:VIT1/CCC1 family predicted Fe2+/Mn2+ transporter
VSGGWLRPTVFGAVDGLVTNASLIAGLGGGGAAAHAVVPTGVASLVAGAFSMGTGASSLAASSSGALIPLLAGGMTVGRLTGRPLLRSGLRQLALGGIAVAVTFAVGSLIGASVR